MPVTPHRIFRIMLNLKKKDKCEFGDISVKDDTNIDIHRVKKAAKQGLWTESLRLFRDIILIVAVFILFGVFVAQPVVVEGTSMIPQLENGERLIVNKLVYYNFKNVGWGHLKRGDIVVFWYPDDPDKSFVKRIVGLPEETVEIRDGKVFIDGGELTEPYITKADLEKMTDSGSPITVKKHHFFVMGDNRGNSSDSREWGLVPEKYIYGKAFFRYWRPSKFGFLKNGETYVQEAEENPDIPESEDDPGEDFRADEEG